jgi:rhodanese-related sulfurtransferase
MVDDDADFVMINVLGVAEYVAARIPGSYNVPFDDPGFTGTVQELVGSNKRTVIVYSASPEDESSAEAAEKLESAGFSDVADFEGGLLEWQSLGYAVESG